MLKFKAETANRKPLYGFGLSQENVKRLKSGKPIVIDLAEMGGDGEVMIFYGRTEQEMQRGLADLINEKTDISVDPKLRDS